MELGPHLPTSQEAPFVPYFYCGGTHKLTTALKPSRLTYRCQALVDNPLPWPSPNHTKMDLAILMQSGNDRWLLWLYAPSLSQTLLQG